MTYPSFDTEFVIVIKALSTHSSAYNWIVLISINCCKAIQAFDFVMALAGLESPIIHLTFAISLHLYNYYKHIISIMKHFS